MATINKNYLRLPGSYLFSTIAKKVREYSEKNPDADILAGMFVEVRVKTDYKAYAVKVPSDAVMIKNGEPIVVTIEEGLPVFNSVVTGIDNGEEVEIVSGIKKGDVVITSGQQYVQEGEEVNIAN